MSVTISGAQQTNMGRRSPVTGMSYAHITFAVLAAICLLLLLTTGVASAGPSSYPGMSQTSPNVQARSTVTYTHWTYLPAVSRLPEVRALGQATTVSGPNPCSGQSCYNVSVTCPGVSSGISADVKVGLPISQSYRGTWVFFSGWDGASFWEGWGQASRVLTETRQAGFQTVQVKWSRNWFASANGQPEGEASLACRAASVIDWVHQTLRPPSSGGLCAYGNSNGASEVAYSLSQYGLAPALDAILLESGPNWSRLDLACLHEDPAQQPLWYDTHERGVADLAFGYYDYATGPCVRQDTTYRKAFQAASVAYGPWQTNFPQTLVHFVFGQLDTTFTRAHGEYYYSLLTSTGTPFLKRDVVVGTGHIVVGTTQGADFIRDSLINDCVAR